MGCDPWTFKAGNDAHQDKVDAALARYEVREDGYTRQFELFHEALVRNEEPPVTVADARNSLAAVTAAYHSQRTGLPTSPPILPDHLLYRSWLPEDAR